MAENMILIPYMNDDGFVPIQIVINAYYMVLVSTSVEEFVEAAKNSDKVVVDENTLMVRPNVKVERKTIILRDLSAKTSEEDIKSIFTGIGTVESVKPSIGDNWFVVMESEEVAISALKAIQNKPFKDSVIHARIKNESASLTINKMINAISPSYQSNFSVPGNSYDSFNPNSASIFTSANMSYTSSTTEFEHSHKAGIRRGRGGKPAYGKRDHKPYPVSKPIVLPQIDNTNHFPPLVFTGAVQKKGYEQNFISYSVDAIQSIVRDIKDLSLPDVVRGDHSMVLTMNPNSDLVTKQRTQSIDMSLRSGMPRSLSVDSVDYTTMLMGDEDDEVKEEARKQRRMRKPRKLDYAKIIAKAPSAEIVAESTVKPIVEPVVEARKEVKRIDVTKKDKKVKKEVHGKGRKIENEGLEKKTEKKVDDDNDGWTIV